jgi:hypothetical protein
VTNRQIQPKPSRGALIYNLALGVVTLVATVWIIWGAEADREIAGAVLGVMLTLGLLASAATGAIARRTAAVIDRRHVLEEALKAQGYTVEDGLRWLERQPGSPTYRPGPY